MHFDSPLACAPPRFMTEVSEIEVRSQLAIDSRQKVQVKRGRDSRRIVISFEQLGHRLHQTSAQQQCVSGLKASPDLRQKSSRLVAFEMANAASQKEHQQTLPA